MNFDLRLPIGMLFSFYGLVLTLYGLMSDRAVYVKSLGLNVNRDWGLLLLAFGLLMLLLAWRTRKRVRRAQDKAPEQSI